MSKTKKAVVEVVIDGVKRKLTLEVPGKLKGVSLLNAIDRRVASALHGQKWTRWSLRDIIDE